MRKSRTFSQYLILLAMMVTLISTMTRAQERTDAKLAQTGMKFLSVGLSARQGALADAFTAVDGNSASLFYNPAGMARLDGTVDVSLGSVNWIADIKQYSLGAAIKAGDLGVFGISFQYADYGNIEATILANNSQGFLDVGSIKPNAYAVGLGYARALTDKFSVGGNVKFVRQDLGTGITQASYVGTAGSYTDATVVGDSRNAVDVIAFDFGLIYRTGYKSLTLGMAVRNFAREVKYQKESFQLPLAFKLGVSMNVFDLVGFYREKQSLLVTVDAEHPRDFPEQMKIGLEYVFMDVVSARVGYVGPADEHSLSYGLGVQYKYFAVDYAYTPFGIFNQVQRFSVRMWY
ncbi:MAG: PorV/PorQ family protein [Ignavibacteriales bacterium]|nr:PorV/PorQ family protein [Ignavibacteriales bacterium]